MTSNCDYLEFGFPLCLDRSQLQFNGINFSQLLILCDDMTDIKACFYKEISHRAITSLCDTVPFQVNYSQMLSHPKPDSTRPIIMNLSYPEGASVNTYIPDDVYDDVKHSISYPSVDNNVNEIKQLKSNALLSKINISRIIQNLMVDPLDFDLLGLKWKDQTLIDVNISTGMKNDSILCQRTTDVICHAPMSKNIKIFNYIDDIIKIHETSDAKAESDLAFSLFVFLALPIKPVNILLPTTVVMCMGILVDIQQGMVSTPPDKCLNMCENTTDRTKEEY